VQRIYLYLLNANLSTVMAAGFAVPPGFCISRRAYSDFLVSHDLADRIAAKLTEQDLAVVENVRSCGAVIREWMMADALPDDVRAEIVAAYRELPPLAESAAQYVAVRSSATAEDSPDRSFAGQHDTYLNIAGDDDLLFAVQKCWASLWSDRALAYRQHLRIPHHAARMAVIVQQMVPATVSGVVFTANPVTQNRAECVINAHWGLGEAMVSGVVSPDEFVVAKDTLTITRQTIVPKTVMVTLGARGAEEVGVATAQQLLPCVTTAQLRAIVAAGVRLKPILARRKTWNGRLRPTNFICCKRGRLRRCARPRRRCRLPGPIQPFKPCCRGAWCFGRILISAKACPIR
jgi:pyruvate, water dikinase